MSLDMDIAVVALAGALGLLLASRGTWAQSLLHRRWPSVDVGADRSLLLMALVITLDLVLLTVLLTWTLPRY